MDLVLRRHSLIPGVLAAIIGASIGARLAGLLLVISPIPALSLPGVRPPPSTGATPLDAAVLARLFGVPMPRGKDAPLSAPPRPQIIKHAWRAPEVIENGTLHAALIDLSQLSTHARIVPSFKNGVANGFKISSIVPGSLYDQMGIENGDLIRRINGNEMNSPDKAFETYEKLRDAARIELELDRRGETLRKTYSIE